MTSKPLESHNILIIISFYGINGNMVTPLLPWQQDLHKNSQKQALGKQF